MGKMNCMCEAEGRAWTACQPFRVGLSIPEQVLLGAAFDRRVLQAEACLADGWHSEHPPVVLVQRGALVEFLPDRDGGMHVLGLVLPGEMVIPTGRRMAQRQLQAVAETEVLVSTADRFDVLLEEVPQVRVNLLNMVQTQLADARTWQVVLGRKTATEKVATLVLWLWERQGRAVEVPLHLSRSGLGQLTGLSVETVSRQMKRLERAGAVRLPAPTRLILRNEAVLRDMAGEPEREGHFT
ncbi:Crp/Fnr family transcriptional regulator [Sagittula sp. S175]|uniref:Crp/Fnr family transcriptional regulator n=1 Tax=Sagittula sp. S175 TaxID=3415129 RepID=UPI003C7E85AC